VVWRKLLSLGIGCIFLSAVVLFAAGKESEKESRTVDSGSFGVYRNGQRVATESFTIQDGTSGKVISSQFRLDGGPSTPSQSSELRLSPGGDLARYEWHEHAPGKAELTVTPNDQFLMERITTSAGEKPAEHPYLMPVSTMVLDNNSFVQREVLVWRFLASNCRMEGGAFQCARTPETFGVIVPQERISMSVTLEVVGPEKVTMKGVDQDLLRVNVKDDSGQWVLWLDGRNNFKVMRIATAGNTEILRD